MWFITFLKQRVFNLYKLYTWDLNVHNLFQDTSPLFRSYTRSLQCTYNIGRCILILIKINMRSTPTTTCEILAHMAELYCLHLFVLYYYATITILLYVHYKHTYCCLLLLLLLFIINIVVVCGPMTCRLKVGAIGRTVDDFNRGSGYYHL